MSGLRYLRAILILILGILFLLAKSTPVVSVMEIFEKIACGVPFSSLNLSENSVPTFTSKDLFT